MTDSHTGVYTVKIPVFEGPLELLLDLIERRKLLINDISLAQVADDYIRHIESLEELPMGDTADFIYTASTLLLIKSKSLLPQLDLTREEEASMQDLEQRLRLLQRFRGLVPGLRAMFGKNPIFAPEERERAPVFAPHERITAPNLLAAARDAIRNLPLEKFAPKVVVRKTISLEDMISRLTDRVQNALSTSFREFAGAHAKEKVEVIVSFLALLELVKRGIVSASQERHFEDIRIETRTIGVPSYA